MGSRAKTLPSIASSSHARSSRSPNPERHLGLRVSRLEDMAKGLVVDGDVELNDLGENFELKEDEYGAEPNTGYSIHTASDARNHERPNHLRLFQKSWEAEIVRRPRRGRRPYCARA